jgi:hypothetical protein
MMTMHEKDPKNIKKRTTRAVGTEPAAAECTSPYATGIMYRLTIPFLST